MTQRNRKSETANDETYAIQEKDFENEGEPSDSQINSSNFLFTLGFQSEVKTKKKFRKINSLQIC